MKKRIISLLLAAAMTFSLTACGGNSSDDKKEETKTENTDTIIMDCLQHLRNHTVTQDLIDLVHKEKDKISPSCKTCTHPCGNTSDYDMSLINDKKKELMNQILNLSDMNFIYRGLCYLGFDIDDSYIDELIEEGKK